MNRIFLVLLLVVGLGHHAVSQGFHPAGSAAPKVTIGIVIENIRPDYVDRYWNKFGEGGFRKLYTRGTVCTGFSISQHVLNNATGTATLFTGSFPSVHGIIDENWYDREKEKVIHCAVDDQTESVGTLGKRAGRSPFLLKNITLGDQLKLFYNGKAKVFSVALNDAPAVFASGFAGDGAWWFDPESGRMVTSSWYCKELPGWVTRFNDKETARKYSARNWVLLRSPADYAESTADKEPLEPGYGPGLNVFPHNLGNLVKTAGDFSPLKTTPFANTLIREFAVELMENEEIGKDQATDLVTVVFSSMDYENGSFGPASVEMEDLYLRLDQEIEELLLFADRKFGSDGFLAVLTGNSSSSYPVGYLKDGFRIPSGNFTPESAFALLNSYLNITYGDLRWISYQNGLQLYLNHKIIELNKIGLNEIREKSAAFMSQFEGVRKAVPAHHAGVGRFTDSSLGKLGNSYVENRSGDVLLVLDENWHPAFKNRKNNYSGETRLPLVFYGHGIPARTLSSPCDAAAFASTLAHFMKIPFPSIPCGLITGE